MVRCLKDNKEKRVCWCGVRCCLSREKIKAVKIVLFAAVKTLVVVEEGMKERKRKIS